MVQRLGHCAAALPFIFLVTAAPRAYAFCRTTTCAVQNAPPECAVDPVSGCHVAGAPLFWEGGCTAYSVDRRGAPKLGLDYAGAADLVAGAFAAWPIVDCNPGFPNIAVTSFGATSCDKVEFNSRGPNANAVLFQEQSWSHDDAQLGLTTVSFDTKTGRLLGADIEVNLIEPDVTYEQARYILTHEAGHFLGLAHSDDRSAVMWERYRNVEPVLTPDDIAAICTAYPMTSETAACNPEPPRGYAADCGGDVEGSCAVELGRTTAATTALIVLAFGIARSVRVRRRARRGSPAP